MADPQYRWPKGLRQQILERDGHRCQIQGPRCQIKAGDIDHVVGVEEGGAWFDPSNLRAACGPCNRGRRRRKPLLGSDFEYPKPSGSWG